MPKQSRRTEFSEIFANIDPAERKLIGPLLSEAEFLENRLEELRRLPMIEHHPKDRNRIRSTAAARQYKEAAGTYANIVRILLNTLRKTETDEQNELLRRLEEFTL